MHRSVISWAVMAAASAATLATGTGCSSCDDCDGFGGIGPMLRVQLLALARADAAAPAPAVTSVPVKNNQTKVFRIVHSDSVQTLMLEFTFQPGTIVRNGGPLVCDTCTVNVSVTLTAGLYGFTLGPPGLVFRSSSTPTVTVSYGTFGNFAVRDSSSLYPTQQAFDQALVLWYELSPGQWVPTRNSGHSGAAMVSAAIDAPGAHLLAALK